MKLTLQMTVDEMDKGWIHERDRARKKMGAGEGISEVLKAKVSQAAVCRASIRSRHNGTSRLRLLSRRLHVSNISNAFSDKLSSTSFWT